ncbi:DUF4383 domain-containing protein [Laceyella putida]|uniref:DUF4383 domain-containing protein n=1 Tax=Laceyella putida TaxID=110101 RepID=A0ABW2RN35_9BACL
MKCWMQAIGGVLVAIGAGGFFVPETVALHDWLHLTLPHNLIHLISGGAFLAVSHHERASRWTARGFGGIYLLAAILGLFTDDLFGLVESTPVVNTIHFLAGIVSLYVGVKVGTAPKAPAVEEPQEQVQSRDENP